MSNIPPSWRDPATFVIRPDTTDINVHAQMMVTEHYAPLLELGVDFRLIVDGGAYTGLSTLWFLHHFPNAKVLAFEADPRNAAVYTANIARHGGNRVPLSPFGALWSRDCYGVIANPDTHAFSYQVREDPNGSVRMHSIWSALDGSLFINSAGLRPCLVKLDVELSEVELFKDPGWLDTVDVLAVELHGRPAEEGLDYALKGREHRRWTVGETTFVVLE